MTRISSIFPYVPSCLSAFVPVLLITSPATCPSSSELIHVVFRHGGERVNHAIAWRVFLVHDLFEQNLDRLVPQP